MKVLASEHLGALLAIALATAAILVAARRIPQEWTLLTARVLGAGILAVEASWWLYWLPTRGSWSAAYGLPLQLCDLAAFVAALALWWPRPILVELTYFWGLGGSIQALLTPDLREHFPSYPYWQFYLAHGGVVAAALLLVVGLRRRPGPGALPRVVAITVAVATVAALADVLTGGDYLYLRERPLNGSLLDYMGPWPWYVFSAAALAIIVLVVLNAPFAIARRRERRSAAT